MDKISIITASYNCAEELEVSIKSFLEQDYPEKELIIIDGGSNDGTVDVIKKYEKDIAYWVSEPDKGLYYAMNKGFEAAAGDWVYIHNTGNQFHDPMSLSNMFNRDLTGTDAVFGYIYSKTRNRYLRNPKPFYEYTDSKKRSMGFSHQAIFLRTEWARRFPYDTTHFRCCADYNQMTQIYKAGAKFAYVDVPVCRPALAGFSERNRMLQFCETSRINEVYGTPWFYYKYLKLGLRQWIKRIIKK